MATTPTLNCVAIQEFVCVVFFICSNFEHFEHFKHYNFSAPGVGPKVEERASLLHPGGPYAPPFRMASPNILLCEPESVHKYLNMLVRRVDDVCKEGVVQGVEAKRNDKYHEGTVQGHFYGKYGLEAELIDAGIMDPTTKTVSPENVKRVLNGDETPQFRDCNDNKGSIKRLHGAGVGGACTEPQEKNRLCETIMVFLGWCGMQYVLQTVMARSTIDEKVLATDPEKRDSSHTLTHVTNQIIFAMQISTWGLFDLSLRQGCPDL